MDEVINYLYRKKSQQYSREVTYFFDNNYKKILNLIPNLSILKQETVFKSQTAPDLFLFFEDRTPYTGTYRLTHKFDEICKPDVRFKIYFDAKIVEVISVCDEESINKKHSFLSSCSDIELKWEINHLLENWLDYCLSKNYEHCYE